MEWKKTGMVTVVTMVTAKTEMEMMLRTEVEVNGDSLTSRR